MNGVGVAKLRISPIVMTLATNSIMQGGTLVVTSGSPLGVPDLVRLIATGSVGPLPIMTLLWAALTAVVVIAVAMTSGGRKLLSVGENPRVSFLSGINNDAVTIVAYTLSGVSAAVAGVLFAGFSATSFLGMGDQFVLPSIAAVVLGGTSILGGRGGYGGTVLGVVFITLLSTDLLMGNLLPGLRNIIFGLALIVAVLSHKALAARGVGTMEEPVSWLSRIRLVDEVFQVLRERIYSGRYAPGRITAAGQDRRRTQDQPHAAT